MSKTCVNPVEVNDFFKPMLLKDLRIQCRARGINPGGGRETLVERLRENILSTGDLYVLDRCHGGGYDGVPLIIIVCYYLLG